MKKIIRAQLYQICRTSLLRTLLICFIVLSAFFVYSSWSNGEGITDGIKNGLPVTAGDLIAEQLALMPTFAMMCAAIVTAYICGDDFGDKTANYEIMSGSLRKDIYFGRALVSAVAGTVSGVAIMLFTVLCCCIAGAQSSFCIADILIRILFMGAVFFRMSCFLVMLSYIFKKTVAVLASTYALMCVISLVGGHAEHSGRYMVSMTSMSYLTVLDSWNTFEVSGANRMVYETALPAHTALMVTAVSLIFSALYLIAGYVLFRRDDMR